MATIKERNGSYQITVSCGYDIQGKHLRETITFTPEPGLTPKKRKKAVEDFARKFEEDVKNGIALDGRKITLKAFADRWLSEYAVQKLAPKTLEDYTNELNKRILPALGHMRLAPRYSKRFLCRYDKRRRKAGRKARWIFPCNNQENAGRAFLRPENRHGMGNDREEPYG